MRSDKQTDSRFEDEIVLNVVRSGDLTENLNIKYVATVLSVAACSELGDRCFIDAVGTMSTNRGKPDSHYVTLGITGSSSCVDIMVRKYDGTGRRLSISIQPSWIPHDRQTVMDIVSTVVREVDQLGSVNLVKSRFHFFADRFRLGLLVHLLQQLEGVEYATITDNKVFTKIDGRSVIITENHEIEVEDSCGIAVPVWFKVVKQLSAKLSDCDEPYSGQYPAAFITVLAQLKQCSGESVPDGHVSMLTKLCQLAETIGMASMLRQFSFYFDRPEEDRNKFEELYEKCENLQSVMYNELADWIDGYEEHGEDDDDE